MAEQMAVLGGGADGFASGGEQTAMLTSAQTAVFVVVTAERKRRTVS